MPDEFNSIKTQIKDYRDYWGCEIHYQEEIDGASTYKELAEVLNKYYRHIEDMANDAKKDLDNFCNELKLYDKVDNEI